MTAPETPDEDQEDQAWQAAMAEWEAGRYEAAVAALRPLAEAGHESSQHNLGFAYDEGLGLDPDPQEALRWYTAAWENGGCAAATNIAMIHLDRGDLDEAQRWLEAGVERGDGDAQVDLMQLLLERDGEGDRERARQLAESPPPEGSITPHGLEEFEALRSSLRADSSGSEG